MSQSGSFHTEVLAFLQRRIHQTIGEIPVSFTQAIAERNNMPFESLLNEGCRILDEGDPLLELKWIYSLSLQEFRSLGLESDFPKIYRGLPRLYHRDDPSRSIIKESFRNLKALKLQSIDRALCSLYNSVQIATPFRICIFSWVIADGLGDWIAALETAKLIASAFENASVHIVAISERELQIPEGIEVEITAHNLSVFQIKKLQDSDLILQIPTFYPNTAALLSHIAHLKRNQIVTPSIEHIGEYGYLESSWFHPKTYNRSMGLHALEKGVLFRECKPCRFQDVEHPKLRKTLFQSQAPTQSQIEQYQCEHRLHLAYLFSAKGGAIFLHALLKKWEREERDIDILTPNIGWFVQWVQEQGEKSPLLAPFAVKCIEVEFEDKMHLVNLEKTGKTLRIICLNKLSHNDMQRLMYLSDDWVGVRGDQSFSDAVSYGKPFFYDGRPHGLPFIKDLLALVTNRFQSNPAMQQIFLGMKDALLWNLPPQEGRWVDETHFQMSEKRDLYVIAEEMGSALQHPCVLASYKKLSSILFEEHNFNSFLLSFIRRKYLMFKNKISKESESELLHSYAAENISLSTLVRNIRKYTRCV